jgi:hypothetical protein
VIHSNRNFIGRKPPERKTIETGCSTAIAAAVDPRLAGESPLAAFNTMANSEIDYSGAYLEDCNVSDATGFCQSKENAEKLWVLSEELVGQNFTY